MFNARASHLFLASLVRDDRTIFSFLYVERKRKAQGSSRPQPSARGLWKLGVRRATNLETGFVREVRATPHITTRALWRSISVSGLSPGPFVSRLYSSFEISRLGGTVRYGGRGARERASAIKYAPLPSGFYRFVRRNESLIFLLSYYTVYPLYVNICYLCAARIYTRACSGA